MARYDRYDYGWGGLPPWTGWYPGAYWAGAPMYGWGPWFGWPPYAPLGYGAYDAEYPRRRPEESPTYGRAADEAARRFARSHGYDEGFTIRPRGAGRRPPRRGYDRW